MMLPSLANQISPGVLSMPNPALPPTSLNATQPVRSLAVPPAAPGNRGSGAASGRVANRRGCRLNYDSPTCGRAEQQHMRRRR